MQAQLLKTESASVREREAQVTQIVQSIVELNELFQQIATLVVEQVCRSVDVTVEVRRTS